MHGEARRLHTERREVIYTIEDIYIREDIHGKKTYAEKGENTQTERGDIGRQNHMDREIRTHTKKGHTEKIIYGEEKADINR